ncbi:uncharacterized protein LOC124115796 [Haliotis rufescens]|uniref:uncharacterized protein LOC124115796 n=1 Tax=Haliotis rufescens TaxID=6454 RepID=UPI00201E87DD|nr:uncharacterized protein LOC124115796 [Haliotis rufescens]XP_046332873.2 uncharacterized protein LOC124115796 [Haliotis rufescens]XP_048248849.1 uncharacterized protein LOC124115796 [Haliotis rufescens]
MAASINTLAVGVKDKSTLAKEMYSSGNLKGALEQFKLALRDSKRLIRRKRESVVLCKLNLASAQIGSEIETEKTEGRNTLERLLEENKEDNSLLACINFNLALTSADNSSKETYLETCLEKLKHVDDKDDKIKGETRLLKQKVLEERLRLIDVIEKEERDKGNVSEDKQEHDDKKQESMKQLVDVYKGILEGAETEEAETVNCSKCVSCLLALANMTVAQNKHTARIYADDCLSILDKDWSRVQVNTCNDLAVLFTEVGEYRKAKLCFRSTQQCQNIKERRDQEVKSHMFQNLGAVCVLEQNYKEATQYFKDALDVLDGKASERRAHLYLNMGFAWSQMGRDWIWKTYEAYVNAAKFSGSEWLDAEKDLRVEALQGLVLAGMAILDYRDGLGHFCVNVVLKQNDMNADAAEKWQNIDVTDFKKRMKDEIKDMYMTCIDNVNDAVLNKHSAAEG